MYSGVSSYPDVIVILFCSQHGTFLQRTDIPWTTTATRAIHERIGRLNALTSSIGVGNIVQGPDRKCRERAKNIGHNIVSVNNQMEACFLIDPFDDDCQWVMQLLLVDDYIPDQVDLDNLCKIVELQTLETHNLLKEMIPMTSIEQTRTLAIGYLYDHLMNIDTKWETNERLAKWADWHRRMLFPFEALHQDSAAAAA
jgi:hypothetical protein